MKYSLKIKSAIPIEDRHRIINYLKKLNYHVWASGQCMDNSECDIQFETKK